jgi:NTP pyrophosphatase (non-canonical NTP hydrolase)
VADVAIYLLTLANDLDLDLEAVIRDKLAKNAERYSVDEYRGRADKAPH